MLLFIIAVGSASAADMSETVTNNAQEDIGFDYTDETVQTADNSVDISQENSQENLNVNKTNDILKASGKEVLLLKRCY